MQRRLIGACWRHARAGQSELYSFLGSMQIAQMPLTDNDALESGRTMLHARTTLACFQALPV